MKKAIDPFVYNRAIEAKMEKAGTVFPAFDGLLGGRRMFQLKRAISTGFLAIVLVQAVAANGATYFVATNGSDANTCTQARTQLTPLLTIPTGVKCLAGGDTLIIKAGTYSNQEITNPPAGTEGSYTIISGELSGARPVIAPNGRSLQRGFYCSNGNSCRYIEMRYIEVTGAYNSIKLFGDDSIGYPHHLRFINNIFHDTVHTNALTSTSDTGFQGGDHLFQNNTFYRTGVGNSGYGPGHNTIYNPGNRTILEGNMFHNLANGVGIWHSKKYIQNVVVRSNMFYDIGRPSIDAWQQGNGSFSAIHVSVPGGGHQIYNNVIYRSGEDSTFAGIRINPLWDRENTTTIHVYNNTIYDIKNSSAYAVRVTTTLGGPHVIKNNIAYLAGRGISGGTQSNNLTTDPSFADPAGSNFRLLRGSDAIDKGAIVATVTNDFAGVRRPQEAGYDI